MRDHLLHIDSIEAEGYVSWRFTCEHPTHDVRWAMRNPDGSLVDPEDPMGDGCWLMSWWVGLDREIIGNIDGPVITAPIPVKPSDDWTYDEGPTLVRDDAP